jgi:hypothetical protein
MAICANCKNQANQSELELITYNKRLFYGCKRCSDFYQSLQKVVDENSELLSRLSDYDENGVPYWNTESEKSAAAVEKNA